MNSERGRRNRRSKNNNSARVRFRGGIGGERKKAHN